MGLLQELLGGVAVRCRTAQRGEGFVVEVEFALLRDVHGGGDEFDVGTYALPSRVLWYQRTTSS
ncbi:hypothetical protein [Streptomyces vietnamensis]|uniref:hypothetical protein n=1 Tax=Streptomyces vietnamensis TaxID=362257 RepID=UPI00344353CF